MQCVVEVMKWFFEDVLAPILIALFTVWLTEKYGKEKEKRDRKVQLQYQYLEKILDEVNLLDKNCSNIVGISKFVCQNMIQKKDLL